MCHTSRLAHLSFSFSFFSIYVLIDSVCLLGVLLLEQAGLLADAARHVRHLVVVAVGDARTVEGSHQVVHLLTAANQSAERKLMVRTLLLDLTNLVSIRPI